MSYPVYQNSSPITHMKDSHAKIRSFDCSIQKNSQSYHKKGYSRDRSSLGLVKQENMMDQSAVKFKGVNYIHSQSEEQNYKQCLNCANWKAEQKNLKKKLQTGQEKQQQLKDSLVIMEKKFLLKQNQYIKICERQKHLSGKLQNLESQYINLSKKYNDQTSELKLLQAQNYTLNLKVNQNKDLLESFEIYLNNFIDLSYRMTKWGDLLNRTANSEMPATILMIKEEINFKKKQISTKIKEASELEHRFGFTPKSTAKRNQNQGRYSLGKYINIDQEGLVPQIDCEKIEFWQGITEKKKQKQNSINQSNIISKSKKEKIPFQNNERKVFNSENKNDTTPYEDLLRILYLQAQVLEENHQTQKIGSQDFMKQIEDEVINLV